MKDEIPLNDEQLKVVGLIGVVALAMVAAPMLLMPSDEPKMEPNNGTVTTPDQTTFEEVNDQNRGSLGGLNAIPASHSDESGPTVQASAGAQTMRIETTTVDGEPALNLSDDRTHDGRWVSVPTSWFNETHGEVPEVARIAHEANGTYTESIRVRGNAAAFYVRGFSTNTVTFGGELVIEDQPAINGTRHSYELGSMDTVDDVAINLTGVNNTATGADSFTTDGSTDHTFDVGGTADANGEVTIEGVRDTSNQQAGGTVSDGSTESVSVGGNMPPEGGQMTVSFDGERTYHRETGPGYMYDTTSTVTFSDDIAVTDEIVIEHGEVDSASNNGADLVFSIDGTQVADVLVPNQGAGTTSFSIPETSNPNELEIHHRDSSSITIDAVELGEPEKPDITADIDGNTYQFGDGGSQTVDLQTGTNQISFTADSTTSFGYSLDYTEVTQTVDPTVEVGGEVVVDHSGTLDDGSVITQPVNLAPGANTVSVSTGGKVQVAGSWNETSETRDPIVELNGHETGYNGTLADGETVSLEANSSWLQEGTNDVSVFVGDGSVTSGPEPQVDVDYRHDIESRRTVQYESEALSERYNISKTYSTARENATLTIPHARTVVSMRSLEFRLNETGSYSSVPESASNLSGTTLTVDVSDLAGDPVPEGTTVEVRSIGSRVDAHNAEISVVEATPVGFDMSSRIELDSWSSDSYLGVGETPQGGLVYYADNESYSTESDYVELYGDGRQQLYAPNASSGSEMTLNTLSARVSPEQNSMRVRVPESANQTNTEFVVEPASVVGDAWTAEYVAGTDGQWYAVVDSAGEELGAAEKPNPIEVDRDDVGLVSIVSTDPPSASTEGAGGGVFAAVTTGNLPSLLVLFGSVGMLFVAGTRPASSRSAIDSFAAGVGGAISRIPRIGGPVGSAVESGLSSAGSGLVSVGQNRLLTGAVGAAVVVAAAQAGLFSIGSEGGAILAVAGIAVGSLWLLRESGEFTTARWIAIVGIAGVVALQGLGEGDLLTELVNSDAFLILVLIGGYALIQLVREYRENNSPDDDRPEIVIGGNLSGGDDEGSD